MKKLHPSRLTLMLLALLTVATPSAPAHPDAHAKSSSPVDTARGGDNRPDFRSSPGSTAHNDWHQRDWTLAGDPRLDSYGQDEANLQYRHGADWNRKQTNTRYWQDPAGNGADMSVQNGHANWSNHDFSLQNRNNANWERQASIWPGGAHLQWHGQNVRSNKGNQPEWNRQDVSSHDWHVRQEGNSRGLEDASSVHRAKDQIPNRRSEFIANESLQKRIWSGVSSAKLTHSEADRLLSNLGRVSSLQRQLFEDGSYLSHADRSRLNRELDHLTFRVVGELEDKQVF